MNRSTILLIKKNIPLFSRDNKINKMSWVTFFSIIIGTIAITCTIAIINGTSSLVKQTLTTFDADIKIAQIKNKYFSPNDIDTTILQQLSNVKKVNKVLEETAYLEHNENSCIANILGVEDYNEKLMDKTVGEKFFIGAECILGLGIYNKLYISLDNFERINIKIPKKKLKTALTNKIYNIGSLIPVGVFSIEQRYDDNIVITSLKHLQKITKNKNFISYIEVNVDNEKNINSVKSDIEKILDSQKYKVVTRLEKQKFLTKALNTEKILTVMALSIVVIIALLNLIFILSMIVLYKKNDIMILKILGETKIFSLFFYLGTLLGFLGSIIGTVISAFIIFLQHQFGFIKVGVESILVNAYPMEINLYEYCFVVIFLTIMSALFSIYPAKKACKI